MKALPVLILIAVILGCTLPHKEPAKTNSSPSVPDHARLSKNIDAKGSTAILQNDFMLNQPIIVDGKPVSGEHQLEIWNFGVYDGNDKKCIESTLQLAVNHRRATESGW